MSNIIGQADGPTAIIVTGLFDFQTAALFALGVLVLGCVLFFLIRHLIKHKKSQYKNKQRHD